uniref:ABC transporter permease n=1 Tax=Tessaracoccus timonensis TaxID=2161816 RepID=UPI000D55E6AA|nr:ABC transporter permease [Tessaracoccus timonensis]
MSRFIDEDIPLVRAARGEAPALRPVSVRPPFHVYVQQLWQRRHFIQRQAWAQAMGRHQGTWLGNIWLVVAPLLDGLVYFLIFGVMFSGARRGIDNFFGYLVIGIFLVSSTSSALTGATRSLETSKGLLKAFTFPRASVPLAVVWREFLSLFPVLYTLVILLLVIPPYGTLSWSWLLLPAVLILQLGLNAGLGLICARLGSAFPDIKHIMPYVVRILMYVSCVMWTIDRFDAFPEPVPTLAHHNPFFLMLSLSREILLDGVIPPIAPWLELAAWSVGSFTLGLVYFWHAEVKYVRRAYH